MLFAQQQTDGGFVIIGFDLSIHRSQVEIQLTGVFGFEGCGLQLHDHIALESGVIEQQVDEEFITPDFKAKLSADKGKTGAQLQQETGDMANQLFFDFAFLGVVAQAKKIE